MDIPNPRRILILGPPDSGVLDLVRKLTGSAPEPVEDSIAGLSHEHRIATKYYTATVPIWLDEIPSVTTWQQEFSRDEAKEVIQAVGAWVYCFRRPLSAPDVAEVQAALSAIANVVERNGGYGWEGVRLAVAMPQPTTPWLEKSYDEWDELCGEHGFEYVDFEARGRNTYGEPVGVERLKEALEANDWAADGDGDDEDGLEDALGELGVGEEGGWHGGLADEELEMGRELFGLKGAVGVGDDEGISPEDEAAQVEGLQRMMAKMQAVKDMGSAMPEEERKRFAAKAVNDLMKDFK